MLQQISIYLLKVICISTILFLYYQFALRNKRFHYYNRFYLLITIIISIALPLLKLQWLTFFSSSEQTIHLYKIIYTSGEEDATVNGDAAISLQQRLLYALLIISVLLLIIFCIRVFKIYFLKKKYPVQRLPDFDFINTDIQAAPFSFLKNIFWRNDINLEEVTGRQILQHEITHIKQKHSWDKLFIQFVLCFYWMNPFFYFIKKELYLIHEFIADEKAVGKNDAAAFANMLLASNFSKFNFLPAQSIFYSPVKRRLIMLTTSKKSQFSYVRKLLALPLIAIVVTLFAFTIKKENQNTPVQKITTAKPFELVVDAGHGGNDDGAIANGLNEKDVTLTIAKKIKELSAGYGVDVVLTRDNDVYMSPQEKSNFANAQHANAFISIHINTNDAEHTNQSGFEVYVSNANEKLFSNNKILASSIIQNLQTDFTVAPSIMQRQASIWVLKNSTIPSALIECGYITNATDAGNLKDNTKIDLMAKNILQGVAAYANNSFDTTKLYQLQNAQLKDTSAPATPLYIVNEKIVSKVIVDKIDPNTIEQVNILKGKDATDKYGDKGVNGVVEIKLKAKGF